MSRRLDRVFRGMFLFCQHRWRLRLRRKKLNKVYVIIAASGLTWREGQELCENLGGHLAEIKSEEQNTFLVSLAMLEENLIHTQSWQIGECEIFSILHARVSSYRHTIFLDRPEWPGTWRKVDLATLSRGCGVWKLGFRTARGNCELNSLIPYMICG